MGMVLELPNRYTHERELYVLEITSNRNGMLDACREQTSEGVNVFRLFERLHQYHGAGAWLLPLDEVCKKLQQFLLNLYQDIYSQMDLKNLLQYVSKVHTERLPEAVSETLVKPTIKPCILEIVKQFKVDTQILDLWSPQLMFAVLSAGGVIAGEVGKITARKINWT